MIAKVLARFRSGEPEALAASRYSVPKDECTLLLRAGGRIGKARRVLTRAEQGNKRLPHGAPVRRTTSVQRTVRIRTKSRPAAQARCAWTARSGSARLR